MTLWKKVLAPNNTAIPEIWWKYIFLYNNLNELYKKLGETNNSNLSSSELNNYCVENFTWEKYSENLNNLILKM